MPPRPAEGDGPNLLKYIAPVSHETIERLIIYVDLLRKWQKAHNLVSQHTLEQLWWRHIADSLQLLALGLPGKPWVDLGSGAGLPGMVLAIAGMERDGHHVHMIESNHRKCAFLREAARLTEAPVTIHNMRIEDSVNSLPKGAKIITARALAPLSDLCGFVENLWTKESLALLPKGREAEAELVAAQKSWTMDYELITSATDAQAAVIKVHKLERRQTLAL